MAKTPNDESLKLVKFYVRDADHGVIRIAAAMQNKSIDEFCGELVVGQARQVVTTFKIADAPPSQRKKGT